MWQQCIEELQLLEKIDKIKEAATDLAINVQMLFDSVEDSAGQKILRKALILACSKIKKCPNDGPFKQPDWCDGGKDSLCAEHGRHKRIKCLSKKFIRSAKLSK